ncbi:MAG TPA: DUF4386 family protein, partial [Vicinamibacterales bacterium]|nr:DUF4386 family protein [Vicinamibacterales bacterium]
VLYALLWRTALVPRLLAILGMVATLLQIAGVPLRGILGYGVVPEMAMPLAPIHVALAFWLIVKGLPEAVAVTNRSPA